MTGRTRQLIVDHLAAPETADRLVVRMLEDALSAALPDFWERRAVTFEDARPRPGDFTGHASRDDLAARDARLTESAAACRAAAEVARTSRPWWLADVAEVVADVA